MKSSPKTPASAKKPKTPLVAGGMVGKKTPNAKQSPASPNLKPAKTPVKTPAKQAVKTPNPTAQTKQTPQKKEKIQAAQTPKAQNGQSQKATPKQAAVQKSPVKAAPQAAVQKSPVKAAPAQVGTIQANVDLKKEKPQMFLKVITPQEVTNEELKKDLKGLYSLKVARKQTRNGVKEKIYMAQFNNVAAATKARQHLESMKDKVLHVFYREAFPVIPGVVYSKTTLFLTGCPETVSRQDVQDHFPKAKITRPKSNRSKRGSYFVEFPTAAEAEEAFNKSKNLQLKNTKILVTYSIDKAANVKKVKEPAAKKAKTEKATVAKPAAAKSAVAAATTSKAAPGGKRKAEEPEEDDDESDEEGDEIIVNEGESDDDEEISDEDDDDDSLLDESD